jgi:hypothetical protein
MHKHEHCINLVYLQYNSKKMAAEVNTDPHASQQLTNEMQPANHRRMIASTDHNILSHGIGQLFNGFRGPARSQLR